MENIKNSIAFEIGFARQRLSDFRAVVAKFPDDVLAVKMVYFYEGQLEVLNRLFDLVVEEV